MSDIVERGPRQIATEECIHRGDQYDRGFFSIDRLKHELHQAETKQTWLEKLLYTCKKVFHGSTVDGRELVPLGAAGTESVLSFVPIRDRDRQRRRQRDRQRQLGVTTVNTAEESGKKQQTEAPKARGEGDGADSAAWETRGSKRVSQARQRKKWVF